MLLVPAGEGNAACPAHPLGSKRYTCLASWLTSYLCTAASAALLVNGGCGGVGGRRGGAMARGAGRGDRSWHRWQGRRLSWRGLCRYRCFPRTGSPVPLVPTGTMLHWSPALSAAALYGGRGDKQRFSWKFLNRHGLGRVVGADQCGGSKSCIFVFNIVRVQCSTPTRPGSLPGLPLVSSVVFHGAGQWRIRMTP